MRAALQGDGNPSEIVTYPDEGMGSTRITVPATRKRRRKMDGSACSSGSRNTEGMRQRRLAVLTIIGAIFFYACSRPTSEINSSKGPSPDTHEERGPDTYKVRFDTTKGP